MSPERQLVEIVGASPWFMAALRHVRRLDLADWCIGAGALRNLVWDTLHGKRAPSPLADVDVAYFVGPAEFIQAQRAPPTASEA